MEPPADPVEIRLTDDCAGQRLDKALAAAMAPMSRMRVQALIQDGQVRLNDVVCTDPARKLSGGEQVRVQVPPPAKASPAAEAIALNILHEDADLVVLDKPAGLVVHPAPGHQGGTLVNALIAHCGDQLSGIGGVARPGIVHRLDKDTSGVMVVAKSDAAHQGLAALFANHDIERAYCALAWGRPTPLAGRIEAAIGRHPRDRKKMAVQQPGRGRHAATRYRVMRVFGSAAKPFAAEVCCQLETGRTHQVRVHLASIGNPLIGDRYYGGGRVLGLTAMAQFPRQALHAQVLGFRHPISGADLRFETPPPADMQALAHALATEKGVA
ncbi:MAG: RluA family pseudouridine synthase [Sphingomonadales bacterium]